MTDFWDKLERRLCELEKTSATVLEVLKAFKTEWHEALAEARRYARSSVDERWKEHVDKLNGEFRQGIAELELRLEAKVARDVADASARARGGS